MNPIKQVKGRTKSGVNYSLTDTIVIFSSVGINAIYDKNDLKITENRDLVDSDKRFYLAQIGTSERGVVVALTEAEADLFAEALGTEIEIKPATTQTNCNRKQ